jgi:hypothetical protein
MKRTALSLLLLLTGSSVLAGEYRQIELNDGSLLTGEVLSYQNGAYTVRTDSLGTVTINDAQVRSIRSPRERDSSISPGMSQSGSLRQQMESDEEVMDLIRALKDDPGFREALQDPEIMRAVQNNDLVALMTNPKFLELLNNSKVLEIQKKVAK